MKREREICCGRIRVVAPGHDKAMLDEAALTSQGEVEEDDGIWLCHVRIQLPGCRCLMGQNLEARNLGFAQAKEKALGLTGEPGKWCLDSEP